MRAALIVMLLCGAAAAEPAPAEAVPPDVEGPVPSEVEGPVLSEVEGPVLSEVEGPVLSEVEGPVLSEVEGPVLSEVEGPPPPFRWSIGAGSSFLLFGEGDAKRARLDGHVDVMPGGRWGRWGVMTALRHVTFSPFADDGLATVGVRYEAAAARPRLTLALHADLGGTFGGAPAAGGGVETHLWLVPKKLGPLAIVFDVTAHLVVDGTEGTRLVIASATRLSFAR